MDLFTAIIADTFTIQSLHKRIALLKVYFEAKFFSGAAKIPENIEENDKIWLEKIIKEIEKKITKDNLAQTISQLEEQSAKIKPLSLFVPLIIPALELEKLGKRVRADFGEKLVLDIRLDPLVIAGAAVAFKGVYKDYSVAQKIKDNRETILASFQTYIR